MKTQQVLSFILMILWSWTAFAQYPTGGYGSKGYDPDGGVRGHSHCDDDDTYGHGPHIQMALILDASGSMNGLIDQAKAQLWNMVNELTYTYEDYGYPTIEIAVFEYGKNNLGRHNGYMREVVPFTTEFDWVAEGLYSIRTGGNQEYCGEAIEMATQQLRWSYDRDAIKMIYIAGNETFTQGRVDYRRAIRQANRKGISVNTIYCGQYRDGIYKYWQDAAELGGGVYTSINHNSHYHGRSYRNDPYLSSLNTRLNDTYVPFGTYGQKNYLRMQQQDQNAARYGSQNIAQRTLTKASPTYHTEKWDLVSAVHSGNVQISSIPKSHFPREMQGMSLTQKQAYIARKHNERKSVQQEIQKIGRARKQAVSSSRPMSAGSQREMTLDQAIISSSKKQLSKRSDLKVMPAPARQPSTSKKPLPTTRSSQSSTSSRSQVKMNYPMKKQSSQKTYPQTQKQTKSSKSSASVIKNSYKLRSPRR